MRFISILLLITCLIQMAYAVPQSRVGAYADFRKEIMATTARTEKLQSDQKNFEISRCAGFAYLMGKLYEKDVSMGYDAATFVDHVTLMLGDFFTINYELKKGFKKVAPDVETPSPVKVPRKPGEKARKVPKILSDNGLLLRLKRAELEALFGIEAKYKVNKKTGVKTRIVSTEDYLPNWLDTQGGNGREKSYGKNEQNFQFGYKQIGGDIDDTGRHGHYIANMILGLNYNNNQFSDTKNPLKTAGEFWLPYFIKAAVVANEFHPFKNGEILEIDTTDIAINLAGQNMGKRLDASFGTMKAQDFSNSVYVDVCDESKISPKIKGPLKLKEEVHNEGDATKPEVATDTHVEP